MKWFIAVAVSLLSAMLLAQPATQVEKKNFESKVQYEHVIAGHLTELNGKYKLRVSENVYAPGGYIGEHHHVGPGIRFIKSGQLTYVESGVTRVYKEGEYFFEPGDVTHAGYNKTDKPLVIQSFELLPADWKQGSTVPPPGR